jgi:hypothetical protein
MASFPCLTGTNVDFNSLINENEKSLRIKDSNKLKLLYDLTHNSVKVSKNEYGIDIRFLILAKNSKLEIDTFGYRGKNELYFGSDKILTTSISVDSVFSIILFKSNYKCHE